MKIKNIRIKTQLVVGLACIMAFIATVGMVAYVQTNQHYQQTRNMYEHPFQVRSAVGALKADILNIRVGFKDLMLAKSEQEEQAAIQQMKISTSNAEKQFSIIKGRYMGPPEDFEEAYQAFIIWNIAREEIIKQVLIRKNDEVKKRNISGGVVETNREKMITSIQKIDVFAQNEGEALYSGSVELYGKQQMQLVLLIATSFLLSLFISYSVLWNIRKPLQEMNEAVLRFHHGDMDARSFYKSKNEFGVLSTSINTLADMVQKNTNINKMAANLAGVMLSEQEARKFFQETLGALAGYTDSQMAAVYLLSDDQKFFEHFESIGMDNNAKRSFEADCLEGEFGATLITRRVQHIQNIPEETRFVFHTVNGKFIPREIITIPILSSNQVIAIISLASVSKFAPISIDLIESIIVTLSARIEGVLAYHRIKDYKEEVEQQNRELTAHKSELSSQTEELIQQNTELEMQKKQLDEASQLKTNFLSNMSHELRTPLNSVIALSGVLNRRLENKISEEEYSYLEIIERNGKNLLMLINDVLDISRIESGHEEIEITTFNANNIIADVLAMIQPQAKQKSIELLNESSDPDLLISSDADKCFHILQNLIGNAVKFTEKGKVVISTHQSENSIEIKVADTGIGILAEHLPHIFNEFRQADGGTSRKFGGTGLGLAIAKKYANLLGGTISVKSEQNEGSEFTLSLPCCYVDENRIDEEEMTTGSKYKIKPLPRKIASVSLDKTILLVEDNESAIIQIKDLVEELGFRVLVAHGAKEAFEMMDQVIPDAMILDLMMPDINGFKVLEMLRNAEPTAHVPVLILTAKHITKEELKFLKRNNVHQLIQKGDVDRINLQKVVSNMLFPETAEVKQHQRVTKPIEGKPVVLVVEDNEDNMTLMRALLAGRFTVIEAVTGLEGIEMAKEHVPNLILMDIALPVINGIEAFKEIRKMPKLEHIPVIAVTASAMDHDRETILSQGFEAFIAKPIIAKHFFDVISEVLYGK